MILGGLDPSYSRTGFCILDMNKKTLDVFKIQHKIGDKTYQRVWQLSMEIALEIRDIQDQYGHVEYLISEEPFSNSDFSAGLYALDSLIFNYQSMISKKIYNLHPSYLGHIHGTRKYSKSDSVSKAKLLLSFLESDLAISLHIHGGRLCHDEAESIIFLSRLLFKMNIGTDTFRSHLLGVSKGFGSNKEKLLFER